MSVSDRSLFSMSGGLCVGLTTYDAKDPDTKFPPIEPLRPPEGAPNVLIVLLDDVGFAASSAFGGAINTPQFDRDRQKLGKQPQPVPPIYQPEPFAEAVLACCERPVRECVRVPALAARARSRCVLSPRSGRRVPA